MAQSITNAFVTLFDAEVKQAYQGESSILGCVRLRQGVQGQTYKFPKLGKGSAYLLENDYFVIGDNQISFGLLTNVKEHYCQPGFYQTTECK